MGNKDLRVDEGLDLIVGVMAGEEMIAKLKESLIKDKVFQTMFGADGRRIFCNEAVAYNDTILPLLEMNVDNETVVSRQGYQIGVVNARVLFPSNLSGKFDVYRMVAMALARYFNSKHCIDDFLRKVPGLLEFAEGAQYFYQNMFVHDALKVPALLMRWPYKIDLARLRREEACTTDFDAKLSDKLIDVFESYFLELKSDNGTTLVPVDESVDKPIKIGGES